MASGNYRISPASTYVKSTIDEEFKTKWTQTTNCITTYSWNAIYAESDEEYDQIVAEMIEQANSYYYQDCLDWSLSEAAARYACEQEVK
jgi:multiple sugar transport system substrate-binding protein/putative aldouronate transport system substrate-binding protein